MKYLSLGVLLLLLASCGSKGDAEKADGQETEVVQTDQPRAMETYDLTDSLSAAPYTYVLHRQPADSSACVTDEYGQKYLDNYYELRVMKGGNALFSHRFTKASFGSQLDATFRQNAIFDGFRFTHVEEGKLYFSLCFSYPDSDLSQPFILCVSPDGSHTIAIDNTPDME